jgi:hypothetical protein
MYGGSGSVSMTAPDTVNHLQFFNAMDTPGQTWHLTINVAGTSSTPLIIEGCPQAQCLINHTGSRTVVMQDMKTQSYTSTTGAGNLFIEDAIMGNPTTVVLNNPHIWARAANQEQTSVTKVEIPTNSTIWMWGYKTEHNGANLQLDSGSQAEIYGFEFLGDPNPPGANGTAIIMTDASLFMTGRSATQCSIPCNGGTGNQFTNWVQETRTGTTSLLPVPSATVTGATEPMNMYYAFGAAAPPAPISVLGQGIRVQGATIQ